MNDTGCESKYNPYIPFHPGHITHTTSVQEDVCTVPRVATLLLEPLYNMQNDTSAKNKLLHLWVLEVQWF